METIPKSQKELRNQLNNDVEKFLSSGGKIRSVDSGVSISSPSSCWDKKQNYKKVKG